MGRGTLGSGLIAFAVALVPLVPSTAAAAPQPTPGWHFGQSWTTTEAPPTVVNVSALPAITPAELNAPKPFNRPSRLVKDAAAYAAAKHSPKGPTGIAIPQKKAAAAAPGAPQVPGAPKTPIGYSMAFTGLSLDQELKTIHDGAEPPDTQMAAGPTAVMQLVNVAGQVFSKNGTALSNPFAISTFFGFSSSYFPGDIRVEFDPSTQRWYATSLGFNATGGSQVRLAVSSTSNPLSTWYRYVIYSSASLLCDQPKLGYSSDKLIVGCTDFNVNVHPNVFVGGEIIAVNKSRTLTGATVLVGNYGPDPTLFGLVPSQNVDPGQRGYIVFNFGLDTNTAEFDAALLTVDGNPQAGFGPSNLNGTLIPMAATNFPPGAVQQGSGNLIDTGDDRFMQAVVQGGELWTSGGTACIPSGDSATRACVKILKLGVGGTNDLDTTTGMVGKYIYYPTLGLDANNNAAIDYSMSSATDYPGHGAMVQRSTASTPTDHGLIEMGNGPYGGSRWGDYGAAATDPVVPTRVWLAGEYSDGTLTTIGNHPNWNTGIGSIDFTTLSLSVTGIGFGPQPTGTASAAQSLTVTNTGGASVDVSATLADSSQFQATVNNCLAITLAPAATCDAQFVFNPTTPGDKIARFNVSAPNYGPLPVVLSGTGLDPTCSSTTIGADKTSPQLVGTTVTLTASSAGCPNASPLFQFRVKSPAGVWSTVQAFGTSPTAPWNTTGFAPGTYLVQVDLKDASSTKASDTYAFMNFVLQFNYCTATNISADKTSPQPSGTTITYTATQVGCPNAIYQWWINKAGVWTIVPGYDFAHSHSQFIWNTTGLPKGTYQIGVWAKQAGSTKRYDAFAFNTFTLVVVSGTTKCQAVNITPSPPSPSDAGTTVTLTAAAISCNNPRYRWWVRDITEIWHIVADYPTATNTYNWTAATPGTYLLGVWVRQSGSLARYEAFSFITYTLTIPPASQRCSAVSISQSLPSPQIPGTTVTFTGTAAGCASASYRWFVAPSGGALVQSQAYGAGTFDWHTTGLASGFYTIAVWARRAGSTASYDAYAQVSFEIRKDNVPCTSLTLSAAPGQIVTGGLSFTPTPAGCAPSTYRYYVRHGNTGAFTALGNQNTPFVLLLTGYQGGWWTVMALAEGPTWPGVFNGTVYTDFEVN